MSQPEWRYCSRCKANSLQEKGVEPCEVCGTPAKVFCCPICTTTVVFDECNCSEKQRVQSLNPYRDEWNTGEFELMTEEQLFKVLHYTLNGLAERIRELKKKLGWEIFLDDVGRQEIVNRLMMELQKRWFDHEVIPVKK